MQTNISNKFQNNPDVTDAENILRACVHCGFCTATCPTYQLLGDELDGPRGRIYLIKQVLEGNEATVKTQQHLDRCLTCRACETTCPSGVRYGRLVDIGRMIVEQQVPRSFLQKTQRLLLRKIIPYPRRFSALLKFGNFFKPVLPAALKRKLPAMPAPQAEQAKAVQTVAVQRQARKMLLLQGCVQSVSTPLTNQAAARVLQKLGIELISAAKAGCCGAVSHHLSAHDEGLDFMRRNIDAWWPHVEQGVEALVITASACGAMVKDYAELLQHDPVYASKAIRISELAKDISQVLCDKVLCDIKLTSDNVKCKGIKVAFHSPCTLQHGQQINGLVEQILEQAGFTLVDVEDPHLCCGSAGTYSILQATLSQQLLNNKVESLQANKPDLIVTANMGCQMHLSNAAGVPVRHWIELLDETLEV